MSSGFKEVLFNLDERVVSPDHNRAQKFKGADVAEMMRYWMNVRNFSDDSDAGARLLETTTTGTPLAAQIFSGLGVKPQLATLALSVDPGVMFAVVNDGDADASVYKYVHDLGLSTGTISMSANASGSTRIDIIECQPATQNVETATRDVYNPGTGIFSPTLLTKATNMKLTYRVRQGTPGLGFPANQSGWLPLAVAYVPTGTVSNDTIVFWDVRPLINDRALGVWNSEQVFPKRRNHISIVDTLSTGGVAKLNGLVDYEYFGRRVGGRLLPGSPIADPGYVDLLNSANQEQGYAAPTNGFSWIYLVKPLGLPRWTRYTDASFGARQPRSPRGLVLLSNVGPLNNGEPSSAITLPASWGLGGAVTVTNGAGGQAVCIGHLQFVASAAKDTSINNGLYIASAAPVAVNANGGFTLASATYTLTENTHFPANAKEIHLRFSYAISVPNTNGMDLNPTADISDGAGNTPAARAFMAGVLQFNSFGSTQVFTVGMNAVLPLPFNPAGAPGNRTITFTANSTFGTPTISGTPTVSVVGWRY